MISSLEPPTRKPDEASVDVITDQIVMQQEVEMLRRALSSKSKKLDATTEAIRDLEDRLEDQHHAYDALQKRYGNKKRALNAVLKKLIQSQDQQAGGQRPSGSSTDLLAPPPKKQAALTASAPQASASARSIPFLWGITAGVGITLLLAGAAMLWWNPELLKWPLQQLPSPPLTSTAEPVSEPAVAEAAPKTAAEAESGAETGGEVTAIPKPWAPRTVCDRFRSGAAGPSMAVIPPGEFTMGTQGFVPGSGEHPAHRVQVRGFLIGVNEVTFAEYDRFAKATGRRYPNDFGWGRGRRPVVDVSWNDARAYARWLSHQTGRRYRLPSEAEWEYAARAGAQSAYWWGHDIEPDRAACFDCGNAWGNRSSAPVGTFAANPFGLHDSAGNVLEWVQDCYHPSYTGAPADGQAREDGPCAERVARGGAFNKPSTSLRSAARKRFAPDTRIDMIGFRLAREK